jgi:hypothetical protein
MWILFSGLLVFSCSEKEPPRILARVNNSYLTEENLSLIPTMTGTESSLETERAKLIENWVTTELLYQEGMKQKLDKNPEVKNHLLQYQKQLIANQYLQLELGNQLSADDEEINEYYFQNREQFRVAELTHKVNVYTFETEDAAQNAYQTFLRNNPGAVQELKQNHLTLSRFVKEQTVIPDIRNLFFSGNPPKILEPFFYKDAFFIFEIVETFPPNSYLPISEVREDIRQEIGIKKYNQAYDALIHKLRKKSHVVVLH